LSGPRDYSAGTRPALAALSRGSCYYPDCTTPIIEFIDGEPFVNFQIAHIRDAKPGNRYVPDMSDDERRAFANLVLLCKPHHTLVDKTHPERFRIEDLQKWKADRESSGVDALADLRGLTESRLEELITDAVAAAATGPLLRIVDVEITAGVIYGTGAIAMPFEGYAELLDQNPAFAEAEKVIIVTARNQGQLPASVTQYKLWFGLGNTLAGVLTGSDQFPFMNPRPPVRLDVGGGEPFLFSTLQVGVILRELISQRRPVTDLRGQVSLGTGEEVSSPRVKIEHLPIWKDRVSFAALMAEKRAELGA